MYAFFAGSTQNVRNLTNSRNLKIVSCRSSNTPSLQKMKPLDKIVISKVVYKLVKRKKMDFAKVKRFTNSSERTVKPKTRLGTKKKKT